MECSYDIENRILNCREQVEQMKLIKRGFIVRHNVRSNIA